MKVTGTSTLAADRATVYAALNDPAVLVRTIPGCQRLEALGSDAYAMTVAAGVGSIKGVYDGQVRLADHEEPGSFTLHAQGAGAAGTIGAQVSVTLVDTPGGGTSLTYDADATVGGMIGGVGQRMLTGVSKRMADEFFRNVEALLSSGVPAGSLDGGGADRVVEPVETTHAAAGVSTGSTARESAAAGTVYTAPPAAASGTPLTFTHGVVVGAAAALAGAVVGAWISRAAGRSG
jgi:carbon monoxide dehydrogenase subunit G